MSHEHDHEEETGEDDVVVLQDAEGNEVEFTFLAVVEVDGEQYALLTPAEEDDESEHTEVFIFRYEEDEDGGEIFSDVEDEAVLQKVQAEAERMFAEMAEGEDEA